MTYTAVKSYENPYQTLLDAGFTLRQSVKIKAKFPSQDDRILQLKRWIEDPAITTVYALEMFPHVQITAKRFKATWKTHGIQAALNQMASFATKSKNLNTFTWDERRSLAKNILYYAQSLNGGKFSICDLWELCQRCHTMDELHGATQHVRKRGEVKTVQARGSGEPTQYVATYDQPRSYNPISKTAKHIVWQAFKSGCETVDDVIETTGYSTSVIHTATREFIDLGIVTTTRHKGQKRHVFCVEGATYDAPPDREPMAHERIYEYMKENPQGSFMTGEIMQKLNMPKSTVDGAFRRLINKDLVTTVLGHGRKRIYSLR